MSGFAGKPDLNIHFMVSVPWKENTNSYFFGEPLLDIRH